MSEPMIKPATAKAMCLDPYLGNEVLDSDVFAGAPESTRICYWENFALYYDPESQEIGAWDSESGVEYRAMGDTWM